MAWSLAGSETSGGEQKVLYRGAAKGWRRTHRLASRYQ